MKTGVSTIEYFTKEKATRALSTIPGYGGIHECEIMGSDDKYYYLRWERYVPDEWLFVDETREGVWLTKRYKLAHEVQCFKRKQSKVTLMSPKEN